jgi:hypothetical protein
MATRVQGKTALINSGSSSIDLATMLWEQGVKEDYERLFEVLYTNLD